MMKIKNILLASIVFISFPIFDAKSENTEFKSNNYIDKINISGIIKKNITLTVNDLKKLKVSEINDIDIISRSGAVKGKVKSFKGVLLKDIIKNDDLNIKNWKELNEVYIIAEAVDNYKVVFSWNEIINSPLGNGIMLVFEKDGKELDNSQGKIILISSKDFLTGPRQIKWLKNIYIKKI